MQKNNRIISIAGSFSGAASVLGSWQICHAVCLGIIAVLAIIGISVVGMPLFFLVSLALPLWLVALTLFIITLIMYLWKKCIALPLIVFNGGVLIAGMPFQSVQSYNQFFWSVGGLVVLGAIVLYFKQKNKRCCLAKNFN